MLVFGSSSSQSDSSELLDSCSMEREKAELDLLWQPDGSPSRGLEVTGEAMRYARRVTLLKAMTCNLE